MSGTGNHITKTEINLDKADQDDMAPSLVDDGGENLQADPPAPQQEAVPAPKAAEPEPLKPAPNPRDDIAARFRQKRNAEPAMQAEGPFAAPTPEHSQTADDLDALTGFEPPVVLPKTDEQQPAPKADTGDVPRSFKVKVRGNEFEMTRDQLIKEADLDTSDPDLAGMSDIQLLKIAQKSIAANEYVAESRELVKRSRTASRDSSNTPPAAQDELDDDLSASASPQADPFEVAIEKIQFGEPEEAKAAFANAIKHALSESDTKRAQDAIYERDQQDIANFGAANADIVQDEDAQGLLRSIATREALKDLKSLGVTDAEIRAEGLLDNPSKTMQALTAARLRGMKVRSPQDLLTAAAPIVRQRFGMEQPKNTPAPQPAPQTPSRQEAKRGLIQQPARVGTAPGAQQAGAQTEPKSRSSAVAKMRQMRGQSVPTG